MSNTPYMDDMTCCIDYVKETTGKSPHTIAIGKDAYKALIKEIEENFELYKDDKYKDNEGLTFMGVNIEVCDE